MKRVERIKNLLNELDVNKDKSFYSFWIEFFEVDNIISIYIKLIYLKKEVDLFEEELKELKLEENTQFIEVVKTLNQIVNMRNFDATIRNCIFMQPQNFNTIIVTLDIFKTFADAKHIHNIEEDDISEEDLEEFKDLINSLIKNLSITNMNNEDREFFIDFYSDFNEALSLYKINGLSIFVNIIRKNICKIKIINDENEFENTHKNGAKKIVGIVFSWSIKYLRNKALGVIDSQIVKYLENEAEEWSKLPSFKEDNIDVIDGEIED